MPDVLLPRPRRRRVVRARPGRQRARRHGREQGRVRRAALQARDARRHLGAAGLVPTGVLRGPAVGVPVGGGVRRGRPGAGDRGSRRRRRRRLARALRVFRRLRRRRARGRRVLGLRGGFTAGEEGQAAAVRDGDVARARGRLREAPRPRRRRQGLRAEAAAGRRRRVSRRAHLLQPPGPARVFVIRRPAAHLPRAPRRRRARI
mmetsp:Transcript_27124/g.84328  ORF Transcript_27124/g.84328 Transcript_27124/m.84328 type:complete len:204 (-) Transcript_27124:39-650(-)